MLKRRLSTPRAATAVALAAVLAAAVAVTPSFAGSAISGAFITKKAAGQIYVSNKKASTLYLRKKAAGNTFVKKADAPLPPVVGIAAGTAPSVERRRRRRSTCRPPTPRSGCPAPRPAVITFSGTATCTAAKPTVELACPIQIVVDGQSTGKVNIAPATANSPKPAAIVETVTQSTVLAKGGHTVAIQYAGAKNVVFSLGAGTSRCRATPQSRNCRPPKRPKAPNRQSKRADRAGFAAARSALEATPGEGRLDQCPRSWNRAGRGSGSPRIRRAR